MTKGAVDAAIGLNKPHKTGAININPEDAAIRRKKEQMAHPVTVFQPQAFNTTVGKVNSVFKATQSCAVQS